MENKEIAKEIRQIVKDIDSTNKQDVDLCLSEIISLSKIIKS